MVLKGQGRRLRLSRIQEDEPGYWWLHEAGLAPIQNISSIRANYRPQANMFILEPFRNFRANPVQELPLRPDRWDIDIESFAIRGPDARLSSRPEGNGLCRER